MKVSLKRRGTHNTANILKNTKNVVSNFKSTLYAGLYGKYGRIYSKYCRDKISVIKKIVCHSLHFEKTFYLATVYTSRINEFLYLILFYHLIFYVVQSTCINF